MAQKPAGDNFFSQLFILEKTVHLSFLFIFYKHLIQSFGIHQSQNMIILSLSAYYFIPLFIQKIRPKILLILGLLSLTTGMILLVIQNQTLFYIAFILVAIGSGLENGFICSLFNSQMISKDRYRINKYILSNCFAFILGIFCTWLINEFLPEPYEYLPIIFCNSLLLLALRIRLKPNKSFGIITKNFNSSILIYSLYLGFIIHIFLTTVKKVGEPDLILLYFPTLFLLIMPLISGLLNYLRKGKIEPSNKAKMILGILFTGIGGGFIITSTFSAWNLIIYSIPLIIGIILVLPIALNTISETMPKNILFNLNQIMFIASLFTLFFIDAISSSYLIIYEIFILVSIVITK